MEFQKLNKSKLPSVTFVMDELNAYVASSKCPAGLKDVIMRGGGLNIKKVFGGQWFNHIPPFMRDSFSEIYVFRHSEPRGLAMLENYGFNETVVRTLPPYTVCHLSGGVVTTLKLVATSTERQ